MPSSAALIPFNIDALFESPLETVDVRTSSSFLYPNIVAGIISEAETRILGILTSDAPSSSNAVTEQLNRIGNAVNSILEQLDSAWLRTRQLSFENQHLEDLYGRSIVDRQDLRDLLDRRESSERRASIRAESIMAVRFIQIYLCTSIKVSFQCKCF